MVLVDALGLEHRVQRGQGLAVLVPGGDVDPEGKVVGDRAGAHGLEGGERLLVTAAEDLDEQPLLRPEVVDQHPVAGADGRRQLPQAEAGHPVPGDVVDRGGEQPLPGPDVLR